MQSRRATLNVQPGTAATAEKAALKVVIDDPAADGEIEGPLADLSPAALTQKILSFVLGELDDNKGEDIVTIDLDGKTDIADYMVVASGRSQRHVSALADRIMRRLKEEGFGRARVEGERACDWVLIDAEDVIVHLFRPEVRDFYNLERVWSEAAHAPVKTET